jgi:hypothetical protein
VISLLFFFYASQSGDLQRGDTKEVDLQQVYAELEQEAEQLFAELLPMDSADNKQQAYALKKKKWYVTTYDARGIHFWNSNKVHLDTSIQGPFYWFGDDFYAVFKQSNAVLAHRLVNGGKLSNRLIQSYPELKAYRFAESNE